MGLSLSGMPDGREEEEPDDNARPIRLSTRRGARVAPQRCPILQAGKKKRNIKANGGEVLTNRVEQA
jgi:hypothetical protein